MAGTITASDLAKVQDIEMILQFEQGVNELLKVLDIAQPEVLAAGTQIVQYTTSGTLESGAVNEGATIPLSDYSVAKGDPYVVTLKKWAKSTTAEAILKSGFETAVGKTDRKMVRQIQADIRTSFFTFLANGTGTATGTNFQSALANAWGTVANALSNGDVEGTPAFFVNPLDVAAYLGAATVNNVETAFGFTYLANFLGLGTAIIDAKVPAGTIYATPVENINAYTCDLGALAQSGLVYETADETNLIGVHHQGDYSNSTAQTYAASGLLLFPENASYIVKSTISAAAASDGEH